MDMARNRQISRWERVRKTNHFFDAAVYSAIAGAYRGVVLLDAEAKERKRAKQSLASLVESAKRSFRKEPDR